MAATKVLPKTPTTLVSQAGALFDNRDSGRRHRAERGSVTKTDQWQAAHREWQATGRR